MSENINELLVIGSGMTLAEIFKTESIDSLLASIEEKARAFKGDPSTDKGRKEIASMGHMVARSKTFLDSKGKELTQDRKDEIKLVDNERKKIRERLDDLKEEVIKPKVDWELAEERKKHKQISTMKRLNDLYYVNSDKSVDELQRYIDECNSIIIEGDADFVEKAGKGKEITLASLEKKLADRVQHNKDQDELAKLRADREEREKKEAAEKAEQEQKDREEKIRKEAVENAEKKAKDEAAEKEEKRLAKIEEDRLADEKRAADKKHRAKIDKEIIGAVTRYCGVSEDVADSLILAIVSQKIPFTSIKY